MFYLCEFDMQLCCMENKRSSYFNVDYSNPFTVEYCLFWARKYIHFAQSIYYIVQPW